MTRDEARRIAVNIAKLAISQRWFPKNHRLSIEAAAVSRTQMIFTRSLELRSCPIDVSAR
jgi:hypothetical protein